MDVTVVTILGVKLDNLKSKDPKYKLVVPVFESAQISHHSLASSPITIKFSTKDT